MNKDSVEPLFDLTDEFFCGCGEPMKINLDRHLPPIGCPVCNSEWAVDSPKEFKQIADLLRRYWLERGRRDYAGLGDQA
jgi:hypothetical protein